MKQSAQPTTAPKITKSKTVEVVCDGGCGVTTLALPKNALPAQYYVCGPDCESRLQSPEPYQIRIVVPGSFGVFTGVTDRFPTKEERSNVHFLSGIHRFAARSWDKS